MAKSKTKPKTKTKTVRRRTSIMGKKRAKRSGSGGSRSAGFGKVIDGAIAGLGGSIIGKYLPMGAYNQPIVDLVVGVWRKNETLQTVGGRSLGAVLSQGFFAPTTTANGGSGSLTG